MSKILTRHTACESITNSTIEFEYEFEIRILFSVYSANALNCFSFKRERERVYAIFEKFCILFKHFVCVSFKFVIIIIIIYVERRAAWPA